MISDLIKETQLSGFVKSIPIVQLYDIDNVFLDKAIAPFRRYGNTLRFADGRGGLSFALEAGTMLRMIKVVDFETGQAILELQVDIDIQNNSIFNLDNIKVVL